MAKSVFKPYANNKDTDQPAHPRSLISVFVVRCRDSLTLIVAIPETSRLLQASVAKQVDLYLTWSQTSVDRVSRDVAHLGFRCFVSFEVCRDC